MGLKLAKRCGRACVTLGGLGWWTAALLGSAACGDTQPSLRQTPTASGLVFADGELVPRDVGEPSPLDAGPTGDALPPADGTASDAEAPADLSPVADATTPEDIVSPEDAADADPGDATTPACQGDADCESPGPCGRARCVAGLCTVEPLGEGATCDDGDACSTGDVCTAGRCRGLVPRNCDDDNACTVDRCEPASGCATDPVVCPSPATCSVSRCDPNVGCVSDALVCADDGDPCTREACGADGTCSATPIPGCGSTNPCTGAAGGSPCDDGNGATRGDMCLNGTCRGYELQRIGGRGIATATGFVYDGLIVTEVDHGPAGWSGVFWSAGSTFGGATLAWSISDLTDPARIGYYRESLRTQTQSWPREYTGLSDGFVVRGGERVIVYDTGAGNWVSSQTWNEAVGSVDFDMMSALAALQDTDASGQPTTQRLWLGAINGSDGRAIYCTRAPGSRPRCSAQGLQSTRGDPQDVYPTALAALQRCSGSGCQGGWLAMAADYEAGEGSTRWTQESYINALGDAGNWSSGWATEDASAIETAAIGVWGTVTAPRVLMVGSGGLLVYGVGSGNGLVWTRVTGIAGQTERSFTGVAVTGDTVLVSAARRSGSELIYELWTLAKSDLGTQSGAWRIHEVARGPAVELAGLFDVDARSNGETLAVGSILRTDGSTWLDGLVLRRAGD